MKKILLTGLILFVVFCTVICILLYFFQERLIFFPEKLSKNYKFIFQPNYEEINIPTKDGVSLNSILFKTDSAKGVIFYLHGNAGSINSWGDVAAIYTDLKYDVFMPDYRGYGKSEGTITSEQQMFDDMQAAYDMLKTRYDESKIVILGYSIGTGPAAKIASDNAAKLLILQAPFYSMTDLAAHLYPIIPSFILKYKFATNKYIEKAKMPVVLFHGEEDEIIYSQSSVKLKALIGERGNLILLKGVGHNGMSSDPKYLFELQKLLQ